MKKQLLFITIILFPFLGFSQGLLDELDAETKDEKKTDYTTATFKSTRVINLPSIEMPSKGEMLFIIAHRFGALDKGFYDFFGLDQASIRWGFEYTLPTDFVCIGVGRSSYLKTYDGFLKVKMMRQSTGYKKHPFTIDYYASMAMNTTKWTNPDRKNYPSSRMSYSHQLLIARKFNDKFSVQLAPILLHKNLVALTTEDNTFYALGSSLRYKFIKRVALNLEYTAFLTPKNRIPQVNNVTPVNTLSIGFDVETGGHVFSLNFTNASTMFDPGSVSETTQTWGKGGVHFGFNVNRTFVVHKKKKHKED